MSCRRLPVSEAVRCWTRRATLGSSPTPGFWVCCGLSSEETETPANGSLSVPRLLLCIPRPPPPPPAPLPPSGSERRAGASPGGEDRFHAQRSPPAVSHTHIKCQSSSEGDGHLPASVLSWRRPVRGPELSFWSQGTWTPFLLTGVRIIILIVHQ